MGFGGFWMLPSTIVLVLLVVWLVRALFPALADDDGGSDGDAPMAVLRERFARGEVDREEFDREGFEARRSVVRDEGRS